jgi:hypothetical protein
MNRSMFSAEYYLSPNFFLNASMGQAQKPAEEPLQPEVPKRGYYEEAGFVAIKAGKASSRQTF